MINLPLSLSQQEVWRDQQAHPDSPHYNIGGRGLYLGPFDPVRLTEALDRLATESDALRLLPQADGSQRLLEHLEPYLEQLDLSQSADPDAAALDWLQAAFNQPFDLSAPRPPWRIALLKLGPERHRMLALSHHLSMDGYGLSLLLRRLAFHYNALERGEPYRAHPAPNYRAFISESLAYRNSPSWKKDAAFWRDQLGTLPEPLLTRRPQAPARDHASLATTRIHHHPLPRPFNAELGRRLDPLGISLYQLTLAALALYFSRTTGQRELVIGIPSLNRGGRRYKETQGMFVGLFPLRLELAEEASVRDLLGQITSRLHGAYRHQRYPISAIGQAGSGLAL